MVGVPRSSGCLLCVQRRLKVGILRPSKSRRSLTAIQCDERRPGCQRCETYGRSCPGYDRGFLFVPGKPYRSQRRRRISATDSARSHVQEEHQDVYQRQIDQIDQSPLLPASLNVLQGLSILIGDLSTPSSPASPHIVCRWFGYFPTIYGRNRTLDAAIRSFTAHHLGNVTGNEQMIRYGQTAYVEALRRLQKSLNNPAECVSSGIFCAVLLLCLYEVRPNMCLICR